MKIMPQHSRPTRLTASLLAILLLTAPAAAREPAFRPVVIAKIEPAQLPELFLGDVEGNIVIPDFAAHKLTIVHLWATWCEPCVVELPELDRLYAKYKDKGLQMVTISLDGGNPRLTEMFLDKLKITNLAPVFDRGNTTLKATNSSVLPVSIFIDSSGQQIARADGAVRWNSKSTRKFLNAALK